MTDFVNDCDFHNLILPKWTIFMRSIFYKRFDIFYPNIFIDVLPVKLVFEFYKPSNSFDSHVYHVFTEQAIFKWTYLMPFL